MVAKMLINNDFQPNRGLGKELKGIAEPVENLDSAIPGLRKRDDRDKELKAEDGYNQTSITTSLSINTETSPQSDNVTLVPDNANDSSGQDEGEGLEAEALVELKRLLEQEELKFQSMAEDLEIFNLSGSKDKKEIRVGKKMPSNLRQKLDELLKEYADNRKSQLETETKSRADPAKDNLAWLIQEEKSSLQKLKSSRTEKKTDS
ncbi:hypothetical protein CR513_41706, partial [Mucuna pruriens]